MVTAIINGRRVELPDVAQAEDIRQAGDIPPERTILRRTGKGSYLVKPGETVTVTEDDEFVDAPPRIKAAGAGRRRHV